MADLRTHPDELTTAAYLDGALDESARERFEAHLAGCDPCRTGIIVLRVGDEETAPAPPEWVAMARGGAPGTPRAWARLSGWAAVAAAAILLAGGLMLRMPRPPAASPLFRSEVEASPAPLEPAAGASVAAGELRFRWSQVQGADRYRVTVRTTTGETLGSYEVPGSHVELTWPGAAPPPASLVWTVEALSLDRVIAASRPTPFAVR